MHIVIDEELRRVCTGCTACSNLCAVNAITFERDTRGFLYPCVNEDACINCGVCKENCPTNENIGIQHTYLPRYAYKNTDDIRRVSSSGGAFSALAQYIINQNGVVYGCKYNDSVEAIHSRAETNGQIQSFYGSKYVQSELDSVFQLVKKDLQDKRVLLFSGTPCQVDGLKHFLTRDYENLYLVDFVCHGVPSPMLFKDHIALLEKKHKSKVVEYHNRSKKYGWGQHIESVSFGNGIIDDKSVISQAWKRIFYSHNCLRESCYNCKYTSEKRVSDITIADYWGIEKSMPDFADPLGVSLVMINTEKGSSLFNKIRDEGQYRLISDDSYLQESLKKPVSKPSTHDEFWELYNRNGYKAVVKKYANYSIYGKTKELVKKIIYNRQYIP